MDSANAVLGTVPERGVEHSDDKDFAICIYKLLLPILRP